MATNAQREATKRYKDKMEFIQIFVPKGERQKYKDFAADNGFSLNGLVVALLDSCMDGIIPIPPKQ